MDKKIKIGFADDHLIVLKLVAEYVESTSDCKVLFIVPDGLQVLEKLEEGLIPDVLVLDLDMPRMNGYQTALKLKELYPGIRILVLSTYHKDAVIIRMLNAGVHGFLKKECQPEELVFGIKEVMRTGRYFENLGDQLGTILSSPDNVTIKRNILSEKEKEFIKLCCTELGYKEIAMKMDLNPHQLDKLREAVFEKMGVKTRVGLVVYAMEHKLVAVI